MIRIAKLWAASMLCLLALALPVQASVIILEPPILIDPVIILPIDPPFAIQVPAPKSFLLEIDEAASSFSRDYWSCTVDCNASQQFGLGGRFSLTLDSWSSASDHDRIGLMPIAIFSTLPSGQIFDFPDYRVPYEDGEFLGNGDPCNYWSRQGTCLSIGNFGYYTGTFDGRTLVVQGAAAIDDFESYHFNLTANVVPLPGTLLLMLPVLLLLCRKAPVGVQ